jgi:phage shock protein A
MAAGESREALRHAIAYEHKLFLEAQKHEQLAARWQQRAELALRHGDESLAGEALDRKAAEERRAAEYRAEYAAQSVAIRSAKRTVPEAVPAVEPPVEQRLEQLAVDDRLERDLAELKARLANA